MAGKAGSSPRANSSSSVNWDATVDKMGTVKCTDKEHQKEHKRRNKDKRNRSREQKHELRISGDCNYILENNLCGDDALEQHESEEDSDENIKTIHWGKNTKGSRSSSGGGESKTSKQKKSLKKGVNKTKGGKNSDCNNDINNCDIDDKNEDYNDIYDNNGKENCYNLLNEFNDSDNDDSDTDLENSIDCADLLSKLRLPYLTPVLDCDDNNIDSSVTRSFLPLSRVQSEADVACPDLFVGSSSEDDEYFSCNSTEREEGSYEDDCSDGDLPDTYNNMDLNKDANIDADSDSNSDAETVGSEESFDSFDASVDDTTMKIIFGSNAELAIQDQGRDNNCFSLSVARGVVVLLMQGNYGKNYTKERIAENFTKIVKFIDKNLKLGKQHQQQRRPVGLGLEKKIPGPNPRDAMLLCLGFPNLVTGNISQNILDQYAFEIEELFDSQKNNQLDVREYSMDKNMSEEDIIKNIKTAVQEGRQPSLAFHHWDLDKKKQLERFFTCDQTRHAVYPVEFGLSNELSSVSILVSKLINDLYHNCIMNTHLDTSETQVEYLPLLFDFLEQEINKYLDEMFKFTLPIFMDDEITRHTNGLIMRILNGRRSHVSNNNNSSSSSSSSSLTNSSSSSSLTSSSAAGQGTPAQGTSASVAIGSNWGMREDCILSAALLHEETGIDWNGSRADSVATKFDFKRELERVICEAASTMGHVVNIVAYESDRQCFVCCNSYGIDWGDFGYFRIREDCLLHVFKCPIVLDMVFDSLNENQIANFDRFQRRRVQLISHQQSFIQAVNSMQIEKAAELVRLGLVDISMHSLISACADPVAAVRAFITGGNDVNLVDERGFTPLHFASRRGLALLVEYLLTVDNVNVGAYNAAGGQPIHDACLFNHIEVVRVLMSNGRLGLGINAKTRDNHELTALHIAIRNGHDHLVKFLLSQPVLLIGEGINAYNKEGQQPIHEACRYNRIGVVKMLLEAQLCDVNSLTETSGGRGGGGGVRRRRHTPLDIARAMGHTELKELLMVGFSGYTAEEKEEFEKYETYSSQKKRGSRMKNNNAMNNSNINSS